MFSGDHSASVPIYTEKEGRPEIGGEASENRSFSPFEIYYMWYKINMYNIIVGIYY